MLESKEVTEQFIYWHVTMLDIHLQTFLWIYCPGHAGVKGSDRAVYKLACDNLTMLDTHIQTLLRPLFSLTRGPVMSLQGITLLRPLFSLTRGSVMSLQGITLL